MIYSESNHRRKFLCAMGCLPWLSACEQSSPLEKTLKEVKMTPVSQEELRQLRDTDGAGSIRGAASDHPLVIRGKVFSDERKLLRDVDLRNVHFIRCSFEGFQGYGISLYDVTFEECRFLGGVFTGAEWKNVKVLRCEGEGSFELGCAEGDVLFEECRFEGMSAKQGGYGNWSDHFGLATGQGGSAFYRKCRLNNMRIGGARALHIVDCEIGDLVSNTRTKGGVLHIENCRLLGAGRQSFAGRGNNYSKIFVHESTLGDVNMENVSSELVTITNSSLSLKLGGFEAQFKDIRFSNCRFRGEGYESVLGSFDRMEIDRCIFESRQHGLALYGKKNSRPPTPGRGPYYWTYARELIIRDTQVPKAQLQYMQLGKLSLENALLKDVNLSHSRIDTLYFKNAKLEGELDLTETTIRQIDNQGLVNTAKQKGKLTADPQAPKPYFSLADAPEGERAPEEPKSKVGKPRQ